MFTTTTTTRLLQQYPAMSTRNGLRRLPSLVSRKKQPRRSLSVSLTPISRKSSSNKNISSLSSPLVLSAGVLLLATSATVVATTTLTMCETSREMEMNEFTTQNDNDKNVNDSDNDDDPSSSSWGRGDLTLKDILDRHEQGLDQEWPWVWCQRNPHGPLYVFVGVDQDTLWKCQQVAAANVNNNLLLIATDEEIKQAGFAWQDFGKCRCGIHPGPVAELDLCHKICMLQDERVVAFDHMTIV